MKIEVLIGMIGSGKTTYAKLRAREGALTISHDDLTEMLHCEYTYKPELRETYKAMMRSLAFHALEAGRDVVVDRTHLTRESRLFWTEHAHAINRLTAETAKPIKVEVVAVTFPIQTPAVHARRRFDADDRGRSYNEWFTVAQGHYEQAQAEPLDILLERFHDARTITERLGVVKVVSSLQPQSGEPA